MQQENITITDKSKDSVSIMVKVAISERRPLGAPELEKLKAKLLELLQVIDTDPTRVGNVILTSMLFEDSYKGPSETGRQSGSLDVNTSAAGHAAGMLVLASNLMPLFEESHEAIKALASRLAIESMLKQFMMNPNGKVH